MEINIPCEWEIIDLLTEQDANKFGEALRGFCFEGNCEKVGCYSTFEVINVLKEVKEGKIYEEAVKILDTEYKESIHVYHLNVEEKDCWIAYNDPDDNPERMRVREPFEIVLAWYWDGDGSLLFRFNNRIVINTDCKCDYTWKWIND